MEPFDFAAPQSVDETVALLAEHGPGARLLAGGQSLLILLSQRLVTPDVLVSLKRVAGLDRLEPRGGVLRISSMVTYRSLAQDQRVSAHAGILAAAAGSVGSVHIRNLGTVGGSLCHADPSGDVPTALLALDATLETATKQSRATCSVGELFTGLFETRLAPDELLVGVEVPPQPVGATFGYRRFCYREGEYPMAVVACRIEWDGQTCASARIAVGGGDLHPVRLTGLEQRLAGERLDTDAIASATADARDELRPIADVRGSADWKARVLVTLLRRTIADAAHRRERP